MKVKCNSCGSFVNADTSCSNCFSPLKTAKNNKEPHNEYKIWTKRKPETEEESQRQSEKWLCMIKTRYPEHYQMCKQEIESYRFDKKSYIENAPKIIKQKLNDFLERTKIKW